MRPWTPQAHRDQHIWTCTANGKGFPWASSFDSYLTSNGISFGCVKLLPAMTPFADFILGNFPRYRLPSHLTSWVKGVSPLSTNAPVTAALASYLIVVFGVQAMMKNLPAKKLTFLFQTHNIILSSGSLVLVSLMLEEILPVMWTRGVHDALCAGESWTPVSLCVVCSDLPYTFPLATGVLLHDQLLLEVS